MCRQVIASTTDNLKSPWSKTVDTPLDSVVFPMIDILFPISVAILSFLIVDRCCNRLRVRSLAVVDNLRFSVGISTLSVKVLEILAFPVWWSRCYLGCPSTNVAFICGHLHELPWSKT